MIQLKGLCKSYLDGKKKLEVLKGIDLDVKKGDMIAIMGRSGSGKSTLLNILAGLEQIDSGEYFYDQERINDKSLNELADFRRRKIGFILQNYPLIDSKNVFDNVALPLRYSKQSKKEIHEKVTNLLSSLHIEHLKDRWIDMLSGGEAQRVAIARALVQNPELILADEPTGSLDEKSEKEVLALCKTLNEQGKTLILVTHHPQVASICHKTYTIRDGKCFLSENITGQVLNSDANSRLTFANRN
ncbi:ABC transporter ATP-binding protein [Bacillus chungangensis]|uniref:ABC transport system ATP-binding protein n=1 Tax=Bacillus chungangensis TaxID=587633 RepID=A0ABT9WZ64_9BACI|nr:ABC transporter ATP-binding protein [Bacillus chungangensis]MDQ0178065.1 putative ABC transport system ATP-binding protein [Bacillus chungangensis]